MLKLKTKQVCFTGLLALFLLSQSGLAQFQRFRNYNSKDGLPSSEVYWMMPDSAGYIWFASDMGVSRFNGYEFKNFSTENGLADNTVFGIYQDHKNRIWFRSATKLSYFTNGSVHTFECNARLEQILAGADITSISVDPGDTIWLGTNRSYYLKIIPGWEKGNISKTVVKPGGYMALVNGKEFVLGGGSTTDFGLSVYTKAGKSYTVTLYQKNIYLVPVRYTIIQLRDGSYLVSANSIIVHFAGSTVLSRKEEISPVIALAEDRNGSIYVGTYDGAHVYKNANLDSRKNISAFDHKITTSICIDRENELWLCSKGHGIYSVPYRNFMYYTPDNGLTESSISCLEKTYNTMIAGHLNGTISIFLEDSIKRVKIDSEENPNGKINEVTGIMNYNDAAYISSIKKIYKLGSPGFSVEKTYPNLGTKKIIRAKDSSIWSLRFRSLVHYKNIDGWQIINKIRLSSFSDNIFEDRSGKLWICCSNGLWSFTEKDGLEFCGRKNKLLASRIADVKEAPDGKLWMVSRGEGVIIKDGESYSQVKHKDGLSSNMCRTLFIDSGNVVWVGTNNGLNKISPVKGKDHSYRVNSYFSKNGLLSNEVNYITRYGNKIWLAHNNGISVFDPRIIKDNNSPPPVYITQTLVNGKVLTAEQKEELKYYENYFNISFIGLSYKDPGNMEYKYKMEGIDPDWVYTSYTNVKYPTVPPGSYRFVVYAKNNDGYWSKTPATVGFHINPAWYQTWWFKMTGALVLLFFIWTIFRQRLNIIEKRERLKTVQQSRIAVAELKALRAQMNPHFVFNAMNSVQYFITNNDPKSSQKYLSKFARLIRYVVDNSKPTAIPLEKELEALRLYLDLESLRFENRFEYNIIIHSNVDESYIQIPSMLIQPYVENAIWHGLMHKEGKGKIDITIEMEGHILKCSIQDNGIGRVLSQELKEGKHTGVHKSIGMSNTKERLDIINQMNNSDLSVNIIDLYDDKEKSLGTRVELNIPYY